MLAGRAPTAAERDAVTSAPEEEKDAVLRATIRGALVGGGFESFLHRGRERPPPHPEDPAHVAR